MTKTNSCAARQNIHIQKYAIGRMNHKNKRDTSPATTTRLASIISDISLQSLNISTMQSQTKTFESCCVQYLNAIFKSMHVINCSSICVLVYVIGGFSFDFLLFSLNEKMTAIMAVSDFITSNTRE